MTRSRPSFVALSSLRHGAPDAATALAEIRRIYFGTTKRTIHHDLAHAIELLKSLPTEDERERARVYMDGLAQMRSEWDIGGPSGHRARGGRRGDTAKRKK